MRELFDQIADEMSERYADVGVGPMFSCDGIQYKGKNFCFFWDDHMVFRLGKGFDIDSYGVKWSYLDVFKTKPPLMGWYVIKDSSVWRELAQKAFEEMKK